MSSNQGIDAISPEKLAEIIERALRPKVGVPVQDIDVMASRVSAQIDAVPARREQLETLLAGIRFGLSGAVPAGQVANAIRVVIAAAVEGSMSGRADASRKRGNEQSAAKRKGAKDRRQAALRAILPNIRGTIRRQPTSISEIEQHVRPALEKYFAARGEGPLQAATKTIQKDLAEILGKKPAAFAKQKRTMVTLTI